MDRQRSRPVRSGYYTIHNNGSSKNSKFPKYIVETQEDASYYVEIYSNAVFITLGRSTDQIEHDIRIRGHSDFLNSTENPLSDVYFREESLYRKPLHGKSLCDMSSEIVKNIIHRDRIGKK